MALKVVTGKVRYWDENGKLQTADAFKGADGKTAYQYALDSGLIDDTVAESDYAVACGKVYEELDDIRKSGTTLKSLAQMEAEVRSAILTISNLNVNLTDITKQLENIRQDATEAIGEAETATDEANAVIDTMNDLIPKAQLASSLRITYQYDETIEDPKVQIVDTDTMRIANLMIPVVPDKVRVPKGDYDGTLLQYGSVYSTVANSQHIENTTIQFDEAYGTAGNVTILCDICLVGQDSGDGKNYMYRGTQIGAEGESFVLSLQIYNDGIYNADKTQENFSLTVNWIAVGVPGDAEEEPVDTVGEDEEQEPEETTEP